MMLDDLPPRKGPRPRTTATNPHMQLDQQPTDLWLIDRLAERTFSLEGVVERPSAISVPGARAACIKDGSATGPPEAFMIGREFAHLHPDPDRSLHMMLPLNVVRLVVESGWGEPHPAAARGLIPNTAVMVYAPRDQVELDVVAELVETSYRFALGDANGVLPEDQSSRS